MYCVRRLVINIGGQKFGSQILGGQKFFFFSHRNFFLKNAHFSLKMYQFTSFSLYFSFFLSVSAFFHVYFFKINFFLKFSSDYWGAKKRFCPPHPNYWGRVPGLPPQSLRLWGGKKRFKGTARCSGNTGHI